MSKSTSVHIGAYLVCKQKVLQFQTMHRNTCPRDATHPVTEYSNFCSTCGDKTVRCQLWARSTPSCRS
jgi:hypothetical protein